LADDDDDDAVTDVMTW